MRKRWVAECVDESPGTGAKEPHLSPRFRGSTDTAPSPMARAMGYILTLLPELYRFLIHFDFQLPRSSPYW